MYNVKLLTSENCVTSCVCTCIWVYCVVLLDHTFINTSFIKHFLGPGEVAHCWRALTAFPKDLGSSPSIHRWLISINNFSPSGSTVLFWPPWAPDTHMVHKHTWNLKNKTFLKSPCFILSSGLGVMATVRLRLCICVSIGYWNIFCEFPIPGLCHFLSEWLLDL